MKQHLENFKRWRSKNKHLLNNLGERDLLDLYYVLTTTGVKLSCMVLATQDGEAYATSRVFLERFVKELQAEHQEITPDDVLALMKEDRR